MDTLQDYDTDLPTSELAGRRLLSSQTSSPWSPWLPPGPHLPDDHGNLGTELLPCTPGTHSRLPPGASDIGHELTDFPSHRSREFYTQNLRTNRTARSSCESVTSLTSSEVHLDRSSQWLHQINFGVKAFWKLPVIRVILWPFQWLSHRLKDILSNSRFHGWRMGVLIGCLTSSLVLCCNIGIVIFGGVRNGYEGGFTVLLAGKAEDMSWWSSAVHVATNALSTLLLAVSNYTMQVLSSPTREDIDRAHSAYHWLDIGILSVRNFGFIPRRRKILCIIMGLSSIPIHLFYNSAVFYIGANNAYDIFVLPVYSVAHDDLSSWAKIANDNDRNVTLDISKIDSAYGSSSLFLNSGDRTYSSRSPFLEYGDLYLAIDGYFSSESRLGELGADGWPATGASALWNPNVSWPFSVRNQFNQFLFEDIEWRVPRPNSSWAYLLVNSTITDAQGNNSLVYARCTHGFAEYKVKRPSRIELSLSFMAIVISCNILKLFTMFWVVFMENLEYIVTIGDGASSFLEYPDTATRGMCVSTANEVIAKIRDIPGSPEGDKDLFAVILRKCGNLWAKQHIQYATALDKDSGHTTNAIMVMNFLLFYILLVSLPTLGLTETGWGPASGTVFRQTKSSSQDTLLNAWLANVTQLILSFCYLVINSQCTAMAGAAEWNNLAVSRKGLRVTRPIGAQREKYFLQLPYRWSLPLAAASGGLHWLLSQSFFLVHVDDSDRDGSPTGDSRTGIGFSVTSLITLILCFYVLVGSVAWIGRRMMRVRIPFAASCSLVISAACHPPPDDIDPQLRPVQWGVTKGVMYEGEKHCSLSSKPVTKPKIGEKYL